MRESTKEATNKAPLVTDSAKQRTIPNNARAITKSSSSAGNGTTYSATIAHHFSRARTLAWTITETNSTGSNVSSAPLMLSSGSLLSGGAALESGAAGTSLQILAPDADISWTGATSTQWSTSTNWSPNTVPGNLDNALFDGSFFNQPTLNASATVGGLWLKATVGQDVTISGAPPHLLSLVGNTIGGNPNLGILIDSGAAFSLTIDCDIKVINSQTWLNNNSSELFTVNGGVNVNGQTLTIDGAGDTKITGVISGGAPSSSLHKSGSGTMTLTGANTYQGETVVTGGTLFVNGDQSNAHGNVTVSNSGTTLGGTGIIGGPVTVNSGANIAPGNGGNTTAILGTGALTLQPASNFLVDINGMTVGANYDQLNVKGTVVITDSNLIVTVGGVLTIGETFIIVNNDKTDAVMGTFTGLPTSGSTFTSGGYIFSIDYAGGTGNDIVLTVVPEPATWIGGALALAALGCAQRRRIAFAFKRIRRRGVGCI